MTARHQKFARFLSQRGRTSSRFVSVVAGADEPLALLYGTAGGAHVTTYKVPWNYSVLRLSAQVSIIGMAVATYKIVTPIVGFQAIPQCGSRLVTLPAGSLMDVPDQLQMFGLLKVTSGTTIFE